MIIKEFLNTLIPLTTNNQVWEISEYLSNVCDLLGKDSKIIPSLPHLPINFIAPEDTFWEFSLELKDYPSIFVKSEGGIAKGIWGKVSGSEKLYIRTCKRSEGTPNTIPSLYVTESVFGEMLDKPLMFYFEYLKSKAKPIVINVDKFYTVLQTYLLKRLNFDSVTRISSDGGDIPISSMQDGEITLYLDYKVKGETFINLRILVDPFSFSNVKLGRFSIRSNKKEEELLSQVLDLNNIFNSPDFLLYLNRHKVTYKI